MPERVVVAGRNRDGALRSAQLHAIVPLGLYVFMNLMGNRRADEFYSKELQLYKNRYHQADWELRRVDEEEGFPAIRAYVRSLQEVVGKLPGNLRAFAYYPFAGCDVFWGAVFSELLLEDKNYGSRSDDPTSWWSAEDYSIESLSRLVEKLKKSRIIPDDHGVGYVTADSKSSSSVETRNPEGTTLIYKSGHNVDDYIKSRFNDREMPFGAVIIANDMFWGASREKVLARHNYRKVGELHPPYVPVPYALALANVNIFVKK